MFTRVFMLMFVMLSVGDALWAQPRTLVWVDRAGNEQPLAAPAQPYANPRISPDGRRLAIGIDGPEGGNDHIWLCDLPTCTTLPQFTDRGANDIPVWTPDGSRIAFLSTMQGPQNVFWQMADGSGGLERLLPLSAFNQQPRSFSGNGQLLAVYVTTPATGADIWLLRMNDRKAFPLLATPALEGGPRWHPDGPWLAYISSESGRVEVYVQQLSGIRGKWQISTDGGTEPVWNPNGRELFYRNGNRMMAVEITTEPSFSAGQPRMLFEGEYRLTQLPLTNQAYDVSPDGQRFLMVKPAQP